MTDVTPGQQVSEAYLGLHSALAVQADLVELVVVLLLEFADGLGHLALPDVPHLGSLVSVDQSLQFLDLLQEPDTKGYRHHHSLQRQTKTKDLIRSVTHKR